MRQEYMYNIVKSIKLGRLGAVVEWDTHELFVATETFDEFSNIRRTGCRIDYYFRPTTKYHYWHFKKLQDAIDFMEWLAGCGDDNAN